MQENEKYKLSTYNTIKILRKTEISQVELVESTLDSRKYIKKIYFSDKRAVYRILEKIECANIPKVHEVIFSENTIVIEEYVDGNTLETLINQNHKFSKKEIDKVIHGLLDAIETLHANQLIHRDIKPSNIVIRSDGSAVLIDYSIARISTANQSADTECFGTVGYAAPEQYGFSQSDFRTDIYAFGITMKGIISEKNTSGKMYVAIEKCAEFDPNRRFQKVEELRKCLQKSSGIHNKIILLVTIFAFFLIAILGGLFLINDKDDSMDDSSLSMEENTEKVEESFQEFASPRILRLENGGKMIPCLEVKQGEDINSEIMLNDDGEKCLISARHDGKNLELEINGEDVFVFKDETQLLAVDYPGGKMYAEVIFYDLDDDGSLEIIPMIANAVESEWANGDVSLLKNYSLGWCIYKEDGKYVQANGVMEAQFDGLSIYDNAPGCIWGDFPSYYTLENGELVIKQ